MIVDDFAAIAARLREIGAEQEIRRAEVEILSGDPPRWDVTYSYREAQLIPLVYGTTRVPIEFTVPEAAEP
jgi:hypothetical protein